MNGGAVPGKVFYPEDWALQLEADFDEYMERLYESVDGDPMDEDHDDDVVDVTGNYFCGCSTCERRAAWTFLMIRTLQGYRDGVVEYEQVTGEPDA